jgi:hypothetical protein
MARSNMMQKVEPDYEICIGIKDKEVVGISWEQMVNHESTLTPEQIPYNVETYLQQALEFIRKNRK